MSTISGKILFDSWRGEPGPATVYVRLLDTSRVDTSARKIAELVLYDVRLDEISEEGLGFCLEANEVDPRARYEVGVFVDLIGDGRKRAGDYLNTRAYPVLTHGFSNYVEIYVHPI